VVRGWVRGQGALKKQMTDPYVVGWFPGGQKSTRAGQSFSRDFCRVFELPSPRNAQKYDQKNREKIGFGFLVDFFVKTFRHDFFCKTFSVVLLNSHR
jgi:hypothetical protein